MRITINKTTVQLWLSKNDTYNWAQGITPEDHGSWPCSELSGHRLYAEFDSSGLLDMTIDGRRQDCSSCEFNAITSDYLKTALPKKIIHVIL